MERKALGLQVREILRQEPLQFLLERQLQYQ